MRSNFASSMIMELGIKKSFTIFLKWGEAPSCWKYIPPTSSPASFIERGKYFSGIPNLLSSPVGKKCGPKNFTL